MSSLLVLRLAEWDNLGVSEKACSATVNHRSRPRHARRQNLFLPFERLTSVKQTKKKLKKKDRRSRDLPKLEDYLPNMGCVNAYEIALKGIVIQVSRAIDYKAPSSNRCFRFSDAPVEAGALVKDMSVRQMLLQNLLWISC